MAISGWYVFTNVGALVEVGLSMRNILVLGMCLLLSACAGVLVMHNPKVTQDSQQLKLMGRGYISVGKEQVSYQKADVRQAWGEPDSKKIKGEIEYWRYEQNGLAWAGLVPVLVIPIPLVVPVGKNGATLGFSGDELVSAVRQDRDVAGGMCGLFLIDHPSSLKFNCLSLSGD